MTRPQPRYHAVDRRAASIAARRARYCCSHVIDEFDVCLIARRFAWRAATPGGTPKIDRSRPARGCFAYFVAC